MITRSEQTKAGIRRAKARGQSVGRKRVSIDLKDVQRRITAGESQKQIAESLHISRALLAKRLRDYRLDQERERADFAAIFGE